MFISLNINRDRFVFSSRMLPRSNGEYPAGYLGVNMDLPPQDHISEPEADPLSM